MGAREHALKGTHIVTKYLQIARMFVFKAEIKSRMELITKDTTTLLATASWKRVVFKAKRVIDNSSSILAY